ncbi:MAG: hypothetical protein EOO88_15165, partial [Pedobacter sp.]
MQSSRFFGWLFEERRRSKLVKYGEAVKAEKFVRFSNKSDNKIDEPVIFTVDKKSAEPGEKLAYTLQTGFDKIWMIQNLSRTGKNRTAQYNAVSADKAFNNILTATEEDRGGINLNYVFVKNNRVYSGTDNLNVPWSNKDLNISYSTFRDKLLPGAEEKWTMKIAGSKGEKLASEILVNMYDASLDQFKDHSWNTLKSIWPNNNSYIQWTQNNFQSVQSDERNNFNNSYQSAPEKSYDLLADYGWNDGGYGGGRMYRNKNASMRSVGNVREEMMADAAAPAMPAPPEINQVKFTPSKVVADGEAKQEEKEGYFTQGEMYVYGDTIRRAKVDNNEVQIRKNFNETAFFFPALTTDADGNVSFNFTIPEALTKWKLMTMAHTKELASGYNEQTVITQKPLMVQPNA